MSAGPDLDAFTAGIGLGFAVAFIAWLPVAVVSLFRRLLSMS